MIKAAQPRLMRSGVSDSITGQVIHGLKFDLNELLHMTAHSWAGLAKLTYLLNDNDAALMG
jgi:hypothetical protein